MFKIEKSPPAYTDEMHALILVNRDVLNHVFECYKETGEYPLSSRVRGFFGKERRDDIKKLVDIGVFCDDYSSKKLILSFIGFLYCDSGNAKQHLQVMHQIYDILDGWYESTHQQTNIPFDALAKDLYPMTWDENRRYLRNVLFLMAEAPYRIMSLQRVRADNKKEIIKIVTVEEKIYDFDNATEYFEKCYNEARPRSEFVATNISKADPFVHTGKSKAGSKLELSHLHPNIYTKCNALYSSDHLAEAVEKSFKVVKDKLRELTGHEKGSDAFGKGGLFIKGAVASNVEDDFNKGVQFLTMAIDMFRNEKSHTSDAKIDSPIRAYEYLCISSLAMHFLDDSEVRNNNVK